MEGLAVSIHRREIRYPEGWLSDELKTFEYEFTAAGVRYSAPEGLFDDGVCALSLVNKMLRDYRSGADAAWDRDDLEVVFGRKRTREKTPYELLMEKLKNKN